MNLITQETCPIQNTVLYLLEKNYLPKVDVDDFDWLNQWKWKPDYINKPIQFRAIRPD